MGRMQIRSSENEGGKERKMEERIASSFILALLLLHTAALLLVCAPFVFYQVMLFQIKDIEAPLFCMYICVYTCAGMCVCPRAYTWRPALTLVGSLSTV